MADMKGGDVVQLKSGGPVMTVAVAQTELGTVHCQWFENKELHKGDFQPESLRVVNPDEEVGV